mgnify:FL=1
MDFVGNLLPAPLLCIGWILAGALAGALANSITKSRSGGLIPNVIMGLIGFWAGNLLLGLVGVDLVRGGLTGFIVSILVGAFGAVVLIGVIGLIRGRK